MRIPEYEVRPAKPPSHAPPVPIVIIDDHELWRQGMMSMLYATEFEVVGESAVGCEAYDIIETCNPRIVLLDFRIQEGCGIEALYKLKCRFPRASVITMACGRNRDLMSRAIALGSSAHIPKGCDRDENLRVLRAVVQCEVPMTRNELAQCLRTINEQPFWCDDVPYSLTHEEGAVLALLAAGSSNREIGSILKVSEELAKCYVCTLIEKLGVSDRVQAAVWAARNGYA